jgi:hypothetical protein
VIAFEKGTRRKSNEKIYSNIHDDGLNGSNDSSHGEHGQRADKALLQERAGLHDNG